MMLKEKIKKYIVTEGLLERGDRVLVAFSGGADSMALLLLLDQLKGELDLVMGAAHVNHGLRGDQANEDEAFCRAFCAGRNIPYYSINADVATYAQERKISIELAGREKRYTFFKEIMINKGYDKCVTAHHLDDQAETILLNLMRGTGLNGLTGMQAKRENFIKPLLGVRKEELVEYLKKEGVTSKEDESNLESVYQRNKIRNHMIPYIKENFNENIEETLNRMGRLIQRDLDYLDHQVYVAKQSLIVKKEKSVQIILKKEAFLEHEAILSRLVLEALKELKHNLTDIEEVHVREIMALGKKGTGKIIHLKEGIMVKNNYGELIFEKTTENARTEPLEVLLKIPGEYKVMGKRITLRVIHKDEIKKDIHLRFFNGDVLEEEILLRHRRDGDTMRPLGMGGYKKIKNILIDRKVSREKREELFIFQNRKDIFYIGGMMISEDYKVKESTTRIVEVGIFEEDEHD